MPKSYGSEERNVKPAVLGDDILLAIGRLVRACAEIEDMIDLFVANLAGISETKTTILLGRTAISRRLEIALELAKIRSDESLAIHKRVFGVHFDDIITCRNTVAHGKFLGETEDGLAFLTTNNGPVRDDSKIRIVCSYTPEIIIEFAKVAERDLPMLAKTLQVEELQAARLQRPLLPHSKAQPRGKSKPQPPPESSQK